MMTRCCTVPLLDARSAAGSHLFLIVPMSKTAPAPARFRVLVEGVDRLPTITPDLAALVPKLSRLGLTPGALHPVVTLIMCQGALMTAPSRGWTRHFAIELGVEQAEEYRQLGMAYQLEMLYHALEGNMGDIALCVHVLTRGETNAVLRRLTISWLEHMLPEGMRGQRRPDSRYDGFGAVQVIFKAQHRSGRRDRRVGKRR